MPPVVGPQQLAKEAHGSETVALWLHQNIDHNTVLIHRAPKVMPLAVNVEEHLIKMPFVSGPGTASPYPCRVQVAELLTPAADRFVADQHSAGSHRIFDIPKADRKPVIEPDSIRDDFPREPVTTVRIGRQSFRIPSAGSCQCDSASKSPTSAVRVCCT